MKVTALFYYALNMEHIFEYPEHKECQTCGERIEATQMEHIKFYQFYIDRANAGDMYAAVELFKLYTEGEHLEKNVDEGIRWLTLAAENNNGRAQYEMGNLVFDIMFFENEERNTCGNVIFLQRLVYAENIRLLQIGKMPLHGVFLHGLHNDCVPSRLVIMKEPVEIFIVLFSTVKGDILL